MMFYQELNETERGQFRQKKKRFNDINQDQQMYEINKKIEKKW